MAPYILGRGECTAIVLLWFTDDDVDLGEEEEYEGDGSTERNSEAHGDHFIVTAEVNRHKS